MQTVRVSLCVPASSARFLRRAQAVDVDELILDLEDGVAARDKDVARRGACDWLRSTEPRAPTVAVRVNDVRSRAGIDDLIALGAASAHLESIVVPKVRGPADLALVGRIIEAYMVDAPPSVQLLVEEPLALARLEELIAASSRLSALVLGYQDLGAELGRSADEPASFAYAQDRLLVSARAHGLRAVDGPYLRLDSPDRFCRAVRAATRLGFDGKWAIHPTQIEPIRSAFTPSAAELDAAHGVLEQLDQTGGGAAWHGGAMIDPASGRAARRVLRGTP